jgi:hypothetical protein
MDMPKPNVLTKILAIAGVVLVWLPVLAPVIFMLMSLIVDGQWRFDFLMPAELFLVAFAGAALLIWAAIRAHAFVQWTAWGLATAIGLLFGGQGIAVLTGMASGAIEPAGWPLVVTMGMIIAYALALVFIGVGGILLVRRVFARKLE